MIGEILDEAYMRRASETAALHSRRHKSLCRQFMIEGFGGSSSHEALGSEVNAGLVLSNSQTVTINNKTWHIKRSSLDTCELYYEPRRTTP